jgi:hypothetical protein
VDQDVQATETIHCRLDDLINPLARTNVALDEPLICTTGWQRSCSSEHLSTPANQTLDNSFANASGSTRNQDSSAIEVSPFVGLRFMLHKYSVVLE